MRKILYNVLKLGTLNIVIFYHHNHMPIKRLLFFFSFQTYFIHTQLSILDTTFHQRKKKNKILHRARLSMPKKPQHIAALCFGLYIGPKHGAVLSIGE